MFFYVAALIIPLACTVITIKTLVGYSSLKPFFKAVISVLITVSWFAPAIIGLLRMLIQTDSTEFNIISYVGFTMFGFVFILFSLLLVRDVVWYAIYGLSRLVNMDIWSINPKNISVLGRANAIVLFLAVGITGYALYEGTKAPEVKTITIHSSLVEREIRIVQLTDLHITRLTPVSKVQHLVYQINALNPDIIFLTGDIIDDNTVKIENQLDTLIGLSAPYGIYYSIGNHEFYHGINSWSYKSKQLGFQTLFNRGMRIGNTNIFVSGIPDLHTASAHETFRIDFERALKGVDRDKFKILLSHNAEVADNLTGYNYNLILSGHTHGGQIFPFHFLVKRASPYLSGMYKINGIDVYVSNGAGTWGPSMRLLAPSEITLFIIKP